MRRLLALRKPARKALTSSDYASGFLLEVWIPDEPTQALCRQVPRRVDITGALAMKAAIGDVTRFDEPQKLVSHLGLIRASGNHDRRLPATDGSPNWVADMLVEAAWAAARVPRPLRALFLWVRAGHGQHVAAIATARKPAVVIWHCSRRGRATPGRGQKGAARAYNIKRHREEERRWFEQAEDRYARSVAGWSPRAPKKARTDAANEAPR
ncbi:hypothetical protein D2T32_17320 [Sinirhodobacter populi]|nr:hypothetical protein D2T32_17320 [Sinirhodobacter populi]